jgi:hypothetical protein
MAFADFCTVTPRVATGRATRADGVAAGFVDTRRAARRSAWFLVPRWTHPGVAPIHSHRVRCRSSRPRGGIRYGLRPSRLPPREHRCVKEANKPAIDLHLSTADRHAVGVHPRVNIGSAGWVKFRSAPTRHGEQTKSRDLDFELVPLFVPLVPRRCPGIERDRLRHRSPDLPMRIGLHETNLDRTGR